jgi:hypothetical protein
MKCKNKVISNFKNTKGKTILLYKPCGTKINKYHTLYCDTCVSRVEI